MYELSQVSLIKNRRTLLDKVSVKFEVGKINSIIGANGAGKSTLIKCLLNEHVLSHGRILFNQQPINELSLVQLSMQRAYIAQSKPTVFNMPTIEYLNLARFQYRESDKFTENLVINVAQELGIGRLLLENSSQLSGGELQLVELVRAYLQLYQGRSMQGKCLVLDEPASALDIKQTQIFYRHLHDFSAQGGTVIIIDHDINSVAELSDFILLLKEGRTLAQGPTHQVFTQHNLDMCFDTQGELLPSQDASSSRYHLHT
jgi:iron complex transport system ATP-binding protein